MIIKHEAHGDEFPVNSRENERRRKQEYVLIQLNDFAKGIIILSIFMHVF